MKAAILAAGGGATILTIEQETEKGTVVYGAEWANADGTTTTEITVAPDGTELKTEIEAKDKPEQAKPAK